MFQFGLYLINVKNLKKRKKNLLASVLIGRNENHFVWKSESIISLENRWMNKLKAIFMVF